jgi:hypothetical protein
MNGFSHLHQASPTLEMNIQGYGYDLSSNGWTVERMVIDEATHESETGLSSPLKTLLDYWREKNWGHGNFDPVADLDIRVQCVDVGCEDPLQYQYLHHFGETFGNLTGKRMMDLPSLTQKAQRESHFRLADLVSWEYAEAKKIRVPMYYRLEHEISGSLRRQYTKIVLPPIRNKLFLTTRLTAPLEIQTPSPTR